MQSKTNVGVGILIMALVSMLVYHPLPENFEEPWKYRFIKFNFEMTSVCGNFLESLGIVHMVNITRFFYHVSYGTFNIRDESDNISVTDEIVDNLSIRIFRPFGNNFRNSNAEFMYPTILFFHGGGYFVGSADIFEPVTYLMAKYTKYLVIYIEYRLIPEHKYPAAFNDSIETTLFLINNNKKYNIDLNNLILMGDSAGGNLATVIGQQLMERNIVRPKLQVLIYPILQFFDFTLPSYRTNLPKGILGSINHDNFKKFLHYFTGDIVDDSVFQNGHTSPHHKETLSKYVGQHFLPSSRRNFGGIEHLNDTSDRYAKLSAILLSNKVSPLLVDDEYLRRNTPDNTILITTEIDILRDDGFIYAKRLNNLDKRIVHLHYDNLFHGIFGLVYGPLKFDIAAQMIKKVSTLVTQIVEV